MSPYDGYYPYSAFVYSHSGYLCFHGGFMCYVILHFSFIAGGKTFLGLPEACFHYMIEGVCLSVCLFVCPFVCLFVCLSFRTNEILTSKMFPTW